MLGLRFDLRIALLVALPLLILPQFKKLHWQNTDRARRVWLQICTGLFFLVLLTYATDIGYYAYLQSRVNFRIFEYLKNPLISLGMVFQSYNVALWGAVLIAFTWTGYQFLNKFILTSHTPPLPPLTRRQRAIQTTLLLFLIVLGLYGRVGQYPLRWSEAVFSQNMFISSLALNPIHYIFDTAKNSKRDYDVEKVKKFYPVMAQYLGVDAPDLHSLNFRRELVPTAPGEFTPPPNMNVVYIVMESMVAHKTGVFGNDPESSPSLDRLARAGWLFRNFYVPTEGTARSMFCTLTGVPDINAKSTSSRNPLIINQNTLINALKEHEKFYFIGGSANWGNIRGVYMNNIEKLKMYEDTDLDGPRTDVWGLSDLDLFRQTAKVLNERQDQKKPFFALIQSASYHRPYTIPEDHGNFQIKNLSENELKRLGFSSNEEYNSFRFSDYSLGEFFRLIEKSEFYKNTIFVIHGDHGLPHSGAEHLSEGYKFYGLNRFHTPLVFFSPLMEKPKELPVMITQPDIWPTLLGLMRLPAQNTALGRNVLALDPTAPKYAFSYVYYSNPLQLLLYDQEFLAFGTENEIQSLHRYNESNPTRDVKSDFPDKFNEMRDLLQGIFETSKYMLYHNPRLRNEKNPKESSSPSQVQ